MSSKLKQWIVVVSFIGIFIYLGYNRIQLKHVSLSVAFLIPFCFVFAFFLYRYIKEEINKNRQSTSTNKNDSQPNY